MLSFNRLIARTADLANKVKNINGGTTHPNGISICTAVFIRLMVVTQTDYTILQDKGHYAI